MRCWGVSVSGYYSWLNRPPSVRSVRHAQLSEIIGRVHADSRETSRAKRVHAELTGGRGIAVCRQTVEILMRRGGLRGVSGRPKHRKIPNMATASDLVDRNFTRSEPDRLWVTDIAEHPTREGKVYCAVVLDTFSRRIVGWSIDTRPTAALVTNALGMAIDGRQPTAGETVIHSDRGGQAGFNRWSQHFDDGGVWWGRCGSGSARSGCIGGRSRRRGGRRWRGVRTGCGSGRRSLAGRRPRGRLSRLGCRRRLGSGGSATLEG